MINGVINIYKEPGFTSHDVVAKLRGIVHQKKIGHTGTLDPDAEGVLPVCLGKATRLCDMLTDETKTYQAVLLLGRVTDTQDSSGRTLEEHPVTCKEDQVRLCLLGFLGDQLQIPPMYSALKQGGKKLYELAREGKEVERQPRKVHFHQIEILEMALPRVTFRVTCSKGTYIRTLCHDVGAKLGCGACMEHLTRSRVGQFCLADARKLAQIQELQDQGRLEECLIPIDRIFADLPKCSTKPEADDLAHNGNRLPADWLLREKKQRLVTGEEQELQIDGTLQRSEQELQIDGTLQRSERELQIDGTLQKSERGAEAVEIRLYDSRGNFIGIFQRKDGLYKPVKMFYDGTGKEK